MERLPKSVFVNAGQGERTLTTLKSHGSDSDPRLSAAMLPMRVIEENPAKVRRVRAKKPKVKSGCKTCKIRRVKCDEGKPTCYRCKKFGIACDGYGDPLPLSRAAKPALLLPRNVPGSSFYTPSATVKFDNQEEYQYFLYFREQVTLDLSGSMPETMWNKVIPRAIDSEPALRNLTIAVSAIHKARQSFSAASHSQFAAAKYGKALRGIQELISSRPDRYAARISVIASMLIFCFEILQGEMELAIRHAKAALSFTRKQLTPTIRYLSERNSMASVPGLEDEVVDVLIRWDNMFITTEYMAGERLLDIKFVDEHIEMPREFQNIQEVRNFLQQWQYRTMPYLPRLREAFSGGDDTNSPPPGPPGFYEKTMALAREWLIALQPLFVRASTNPTSREFLILALQKTTGILTYLALQRACLGDGSTTPGLFEPESVALIELGDRIVQHPFYRKAFAFDIGLIEAMYLVCMVCRKREICEEALRILKLATGRVEMMASADMFAEKSEMILQMRFPGARTEAEGINYRDFWASCPDWKWLL